VSVFNFISLAKKSAGLVEEEDRVARFGSLENPIEVLLSFADVRAEDFRQVDTIEFASQRWSLPTASQTCGGS
jgi:hypothetical protein